MRIRDVKIGLRGRKKERKKFLESWIEKYGSLSDEDKQYARILMKKQENLDKIKKELEIS